MLVGFMILVLSILKCFLQKKCTSQEVCSRISQWNSILELHHLVSQAIVNFDSSDIFIVI